ncbi:hypothetical protein JOC75_003927 [Metabacillus crassostreae]|uniref:DUF4430 domain-containing protein n=1 Tax=Metabacillus crassostreae TaxID=929098 RepID=UPI00195CD80C|nr:DUF4430 domain-containing protein [Metabacillus crassostreae]MBM7605899.1 hypothetical protein [Metabacillus crassostreae]
MLNKVRLSLLSFLLVFTVFFGNLQEVNAASEEKSFITLINANGEVVLDNEFTFQEGLTVEEALIKNVGEEKVKYDEYGMISEINDIKPVGKTYWAIYVNGISSQMAADQQKFESGDRITFKVTNWESNTDKSASITLTGHEELKFEEKYLSFINNPSAYDLLKMVVNIDEITTLTSNGDSQLSSDWELHVNDEIVQDINSYNIHDGHSFVLKKINNEPEEEEEQPLIEKPTSNPFDAVQFNKDVNSASQYILSNKVEDWQAVALNKAQKSLPASYSVYLKTLVNESKLSKITDYERVTLGILASGEDPRNFEGQNLVESIYNGNVTNQGLNGVAYALIALDSANFQVPETAKWTREKLIAELLKNQHDDGGWSWSLNPPSDSDTTAMVLTALAPYKNQADVSLAIEKAVNYLIEQYQGSAVDNSSTAATIVIALSALGIDSHSEDFTKNGSSLIEFLLTFQNKDGGFDWQGGEESDSFSSDQGYRGIVAYQLFLEGKGSLYTLPLNTNKVEKGNLVVKGHSDLVIKASNVYKVKQDAKTFTFTSELLKGLPKNSSIEVSNGKVNATVPVALLLTNSDVTFSFGEVSEAVKNTSDLVSDLYDFTITSDGKTISDFGNHVVTLGFDLTNFNGDWDQLRIYHVDENGNKLEKMKTTYDAKTKQVFASVGHFSIYGVFELQKNSVDEPVVKEDNSSEQQGEVQQDQVQQKEKTSSNGNRLPNTATPLFNLIALGGALMLIGAGGTIYSRRRQTN